MSALQIDTRFILDLAITTAKINDLAVTTAKVNDLAITTAKLADLNVTTGKIANDAITTAKILDANVTSAKLQASIGLTGAPTAPSAAFGTSTTQIATTAFVQTVIKIGRASCRERVYVLV